MTPELKEKWLDALRSGKYEQTREHLRLGGGFCCLGVLCDVSRVGWWGEGSDDTTYFISLPTELGYRQSGSVGYLSDHLCKVLGISHSNMDHLANMNDHGASFLAIAAMIEKEGIEPYTQHIEDEPEDVLE